MSQRRMFVCCADEQERNLSLGKVLLALSWLFYSNERFQRNVDQRIHREDAFHGENGFVGRGSVATFLPSSAV